MHLLFSDQSTVEIELYDNDVALEYKKYFKHLQHVDVDFKEWDNPFSQTDCKHLLRYYANKLCINIPDNQSLQDQKFLNKLHKIYEKNYDGSPHWLDMHEQIHRCEDIGVQTARIFRVDYREKGGPLIKKFKQNWLDIATSTLNAGDIFISWSELGKTPYHYWCDNEPDDLSRVCQLVKPWLHLATRISIACEQLDLLEGKKYKEFDQWWYQFKDSWHAYWNVKDYSLEKQYSVIKIGKVKNLQKMNQILMNGVGVKKVCL